MIARGIDTKKRKKKTATVAMDEATVSQCQIVSRRDICRNQESRSRPAIIPITTGTISRKGLSI